jgi:hypothetical protein
LCGTARLCVGILDDMYVVERLWKVLHTKGGSSRLLLAEALFKAGCGAVMHTDTTDRH